MSSTGHLNREKIAAAALAIADAEGFACVSMRRLAQELLVGTMSLYYYVGTKAELGKDTSMSDGAVVFVAHPARSRSSGVMTFVVTSDDVVFQKDLGPNTTRLAKAIGKTTPNLSWQLAE